MSVLKFLRKTALWIVAVPILCYYLGAGLNQVVLKANHDRFPVMWNDYKVGAYRLELEKKIQWSKDPDVAIEAEFNLEALNHGFLDDTHVLMTPETKLNFFGDWIQLRGDGTYSIGDLLLILGGQGMDITPFIWFTVVIMRLNKKEE